MITAEVVDIRRVGNRVVVVIQFSDETSREFVFDLPTTIANVRSEIKRELDKLNSLQTEVDSLRSWIGTVIS